MLIGNHLSASKGYAAMGRAAIALGANTFAFFTRNPRGGKAKEINPEDVKKLLLLMLLCRVVMIIWLDVHLIR